MKVPKGRRSMTNDFVQTSYYHYYYISTRIPAFPTRTLA